MKSKFADRKRNILRKLYGILSLSTALFVFQACYGSPHDMGLDVHIQGTVKSNKTNAPIPGIKVSVENNPQFEYTDNSGNFTIYISRADVYKIKFEDIDSAKNGEFLPKDTIVNNTSGAFQITIGLDVK